MEAKKEESWKQKLPTKSKEYRNGGTLRDYQIEGTVVILLLFFCCTAFQCIPTY